MFLQALPYQILHPAAGTGDDVRPPPRLAGQGADERPNEIFFVHHINLSQR